MPERSGLVAPLRPRSLRTSDLDTVEKIEREIYDFPWSRGNFVDSMSAGYDAWVFEQNTEIFAYAILMWSIDEVHLLNLSVSRTHQGQRFGAGVLHWLIDDLSSRKARELYLEVRPSNPIAQRLYFRSGFEQIGIRKRYYPAQRGEREDALVLRKRLNP